MKFSDKNRHLSQVRNVQVNIALEVMIEMLCNNPSKYFNQKLEAESKAA